VGAYIGGLLADRFPYQSTLGWLLCFSGIGALSVPFLSDAVGGGSFLWVHLGLGTSLLLRIVLAAIMIFFLPTLGLRMLSSLAVKLTGSNLQQPGIVVGKIYACSTLGSIAGTFATGLFLIEWMGTRMLVFATAAVLLVCAPLFGGLFRRQKPLLGVYAVSTLLFLAGAAFTQPGWYGLCAPVFHLRSRPEGWPASLEGEYATTTRNDAPMARASNARSFSTVCVTPPVTPTTLPTSITIICATTRRSCAGKPSRKPVASMPCSSAAAATTSRAWWRPTIRRRSWMS